MDEWIESGTDHAVDKRTLGCGGFPILTLLLRLPVGLIAGRPDASSSLVRQQRQREIGG